MQPTAERELPMLAGIGAFVTWCEELLAILSGPILTFGLAIALVALLTDGALLVRIPALLYVWAASQAVGLDAQFIGSAAKLARAIRQRRGWPIFGYIVLCTALGYVGYVASNVFATQEANGITTAAALARLGMDSTSWIVQRSALAVGLVFLSGLLRYVAPQRDAALSAEEERDRLQRELELEPLRNQLRAQQLRGVRGAWGALRGKDSTIEQPLPPPLHSQGRAPKTTPAPYNPSRPPTGPGSPATAHPSHTASAQEYSLPAGVTDETEQDDDEQENSRVLHIRRSRSARAANARKRREEMHARRNVIREAVHAIMDLAALHGEAVDALSIREIVRRVNASGRLGSGIQTSAKTVKPHIASWLRDQQRVAAK